MDVTPEAITQQMVATANIVWTGDLKAASRAVVVSPIVADKVSIRDGRPAFRSPITFERELARARLAALEARDARKADRSGARARASVLGVRLLLLVLRSCGPLALPALSCGASDLRRPMALGRSPLRLPT